MIFPDRSPQKLQGTSRGDRPKGTVNSRFRRSRVECGAADSPIAVRVAGQSGLNMKVKCKV
ncbi:hypothetical protein JJD41_09735 [Oxynema sp. CENA135]|uniref:hypothetical protein n=1 Tax=Oxynema sp. CENA135 TaxID=984206 RepID=UPI00190DD1E8|nr:hypothetical protein [Oxynema sp. CENA135]MBK4730136.1 hypothetical protein [Oxynema sp. CENA135]